MLRVVSNNMAYCLSTHPISPRISLQKKINIYLYIYKRKKLKTFSGELLCFFTCSDEMVDECVVILCPEQRAGENHAVEWNVVFCHEVVQLHLEDKPERHIKYHLFGNKYNN